MTSSEERTSAEAEGYRIERSLMDCVAPVRRRGGRSNPSVSSSRFSVGRVFLFTYILGSEVSVDINPHVIKSGASGIARPENAVEMRPVNLFLQRVVDRKPELDKVMHLSLIQL